MLLEALLLILFILLVVDPWKSRRFVELHRELGNDFTTWPIVGNALNFLGNNEDMMNTFLQYTLQAYKRKHKATSFWLGNRMFVLIADADQASVVLKNALEKSFVFDLTKSLGGYVSVFAPVKYWIPRRKITMSIFASKHVNKFVPIFEEQSRIAAEVLETKVGIGNISCSDNFYPNALAFVCGTVFGHNIDMQRQPDHPFFKAFVDWLKNASTRVFQPWLHDDRIYKLSPAHSKQEHNKHIIHSFIDGLIQQGKTEMDKSGNPEISDSTIDAKTKPAYDTLLKLLKEYSKEAGKEYSDEEVREEVIGIALAATDTSALTFSFMIVLLSQHMDVQDKVYNEIQNLLGDSEKPLEADDLLKLKYTRAVIKESLRLYPPGPLSLRYCTQDIQLPSGLVLPKGCDVLVSNYGIQRNPEHWGEDANEFKPERFLTGQIPKQNAFMAFSRGPRNCVGRNYAMLSLTTLLVVLLRRYRFTPAADFKYDSQLRLSFYLTMKNTDDFLVQVEYRDDFKRDIIE